MSSASAPLLLDTHYWVWLQFGVRERMTPSELNAIDKAATLGDLRLSVVSVWEVAMLESKGRLQLYVPCEQWVRDALAMPGLSLALLTPEIAIASTRLPEPFHGDPADRIIVATARALGARLVTRDRKIREYARKRHVSIL
ncbi:MAG TPA: type II toxin-antitoxin system VapC family toxin [Bryobacteraceae bacterium]|jgi:PIN domain nuclease of toxin-antitoxin system|nr:type II toxin-antitoxin system VapC family toxin [Bryobacteraceae bacterium]